MAIVWAVSAFFAGVLATTVAVRWLNTGRESSVPDYEALIDSVNEVLFSLDSEGRVQVTNESFREQFGAGQSGRDVEEVFESYPELRTQLREREDGMVTVEMDDREQHLELCSYQVSGSEGAMLVLLHDITAREQRREALQEQNEKLDRFASLISHDLRNPLDVAIGRTSAIARMNEDSELDPHIEKTEDSLRRMHQIITDVLALARQGEHIGEKRPVNLQEVATDAWSHVETDAASLDIEGELVLLADQDALEHIFENLFRNSVEHGGTGVDVRVGILPDRPGFFVADDGKGIPVDADDEIFEAGNTASEDGTGLGLAIVDSIATAHGWEVTVTDSPSGGAQFEFSGVELPTDEIVAGEQN